MYRRELRLVDASNASLFGRDFGVTLEFVIQVHYTDAQRRETRKWFQMHWSRLG